MDDCNECECGGRNFVIDFTQWDRICKDCGAVTSPEIELEEHYDTTVYRDSKLIHLKNILNKISWDNYTQEDMEYVEKRFKYYVQLFYDTRPQHGRRSMINYHFTLLKILELRGEENIVARFKLKIPKLKSTLLKLEETWNIMTN